MAFIPPLGSVAAWIQSDNASVITVLQNSSIIALQSGSVVSINQGSIAAVIIGGSIATSSPANQSVSGTVGASIIGNVPVVVQSSIAVAIISGSVSALLSSSSASVISTIQGSIAGEYASNSSSVVSGVGMLALGVRNDTLSSTLSTSTADGRYTPFTVGPWGEQVVGNAPGNKWVSGATSVFTGVPQPVITSVAGSFVNITGVQVANNSGTAVYVTFSGAGIGSVAGSVLAYTIAPANGGSNISFANALKTGLSNPLQASISGVASVFVSAQGFLSNT